MITLNSQSWLDMDLHVSRTLQSLTRSKIHELGKQRKTYESQKTEELANADRCATLRERVEYLLASVRKLCPNLKNVTETSNIEHWVQQAKFDSSIPPEKLQEFEKYLRNKLEVQSRKLRLADLYSRLLTEWMNPPSEMGQTDESSSHEPDDFLVLENKQKQRLEQLCDQFETTVFEPYDTDPIKIKDFLDSLFQNEDQMKELNSFRDDIRTTMDRYWDHEAPFTVESLSKCIRGIQCEDVITDEKQETLKHFLNNEVALSEIADVLNMRYADLENWDWHTGEEGVPFLPRQQLNGKYRIWMDDDILETIFVEHICVQICNKLKEALARLIEKEGMCNFVQGHKITKND